MKLEVWNRAGLLGLYQNKVKSSLASTQRPGHQAHNCKMDFLSTDLIRYKSATEICHSKEIEIHILSVSPSSEGLRLKTSAFNLFTVANLPYQLTTTQLINPKFCVSLPHQHSTKVSLETNSLIISSVNFTDR